MNKIYHLDKLSDKKILELSLHYFSNIANNLEISTEETKEFLLVYLEYILRINGIESNNYEITINLVKKLNLFNANAYLHYFKKHKKFDVYLSKDNLLLGYFDDQIYSKGLGKPNKPWNRDHNSKETLHFFINNLTIAGHEFHHIVQLIKKEELDAEYARRFQTAPIKSVFTVNEDGVSVLASKTNDSLDELSSIHPMEIEANMLSFEYMHKLIDSLIKECKSENTSALLLKFDRMVKLDRKDAISKYVKQGLTHRKVTNLVGNLEYDSEVAGSSLSSFSIS